MKLIFTWAIFLIVMILHIIAIIFIIKKFLQIDEVSVKKSPESTEEEPVLISIILIFIIGFVAFCVTLSGLMCIIYHPSPPGVVTDFIIPSLDRTPYIYNFIKGLILIESAIFLPYGLNLLLYKLWYKKTGLSKWKIFPSIIIGIGNFILCVFVIILLFYDGLSL
ncbi:MAG: hypothetical protein K2J25_02570 [Oscillospiraceae bacterium]|nr:hypothetical protein [Oscillospiraceae bacterium]